MNMNILKREDAVSPVIGVILMVAITVILAAVIAAFVFGMAGSVQKTKSVAATAKQDGSRIVVTWEGGTDNAYVLGYNVTLFDSVIYPGLQGADTAWYPPIVGNSTAFGKGAATSGPPYHVVVTAAFSDGSDQVVLDVYV
jgi:flagellin-like protein